MRKGAQWFDESETILNYDSLPTPEHSKSIFYAQEPQDVSLRSWSRVIIVSVICIALFFLAVFYLFG